MFLRMLMGAIALSILVSQAFAGPGERVPMERFFSAVSKATGEEYGKIERDGYRALRDSKAFSQADLDIIHGEKGDAAIAMERRMVRFLQHDRSFLVNAGVVRVRDARLEKMYARAMDRYSAYNREAEIKTAVLGVEMQVTHFEATTMKVELLLSKIELMRKDGTDKTDPAAFASLFQQKTEAARELEATGDSYVRSVLRLLSEVGIPYEEATDGTGLSAVIPYSTSSAKLFKALKADPRFSRIMRDRPTVRVSYPSVGGTVVMDSSSNTIYVGLDTLSRLY